MFKKNKYDGEQKLYEDLQEKGVQLNTDQILNLDTAKIGR